MSYILFAVISILGLWFNTVPTEAQYITIVDKEEAGEYNSYVDMLRGKRELSPVTHTKHSPEEEANVFSNLTFWWYSPLLAYGFQHALVDEDLWDLLQEDRSRVSHARLRSAWQKQKRTRGEKASVPRALWSAFGASFCFTGIFKFISDSMEFLGPVLLGEVISFVSDEDAPLYYGLLLALGMYITKQIGSLSLHVYFKRGFRDGMRARAALSMEIYTKSFTQSNEARQADTVGRIVNLMSIDAGRVDDLTPYLHYVWSGPYQIIVCMGLLWNVVGPAVFAGVFIMIILIPINMVLAKYMARIQKEMLGKKDARSKDINEMLQGIRVIKFFAWEKPFRKQINAVRDSELVTLRKVYMFIAVVVVLWSITPVMVAVCTFATYSALGNELDATTAFTALALFNILRFPLNMLPRIIMFIVEAKVSTDRIQNYLLGSELDPTAVTRGDSAEPIAIEMKSGTFHWDKPSDTNEPVLQDIDFSIKRGSLTAIVGAVGSGKSSLLNALLGNLYKDPESEVHVNGSIAYVAQSAWIQNKSLRDNILYGSDYNERKYKSVVATCELTQDLAMLPAGDATEIGEKGINLSGGQKQRVNMARAVYASRDIYFLDDPLSAVDAHVGNAIFQNCIKQTLAGKTRILVTHQLQHLNDVDHILVLKDGQIAESGSFDELMAAKGEFEAMIRTHVSERKQKQAEDSDTEALSDGATTDAEGHPKSAAAAAAAKEEKAKAGKLVSIEEREEGSVSWQVYFKYITAIGGIGLASGIFFAYLMDSITSVGSNIWLSIWSDASDNESNVWFYLGIYAAWGFSNTFFVFLRSVLLLVIGAMNSAKKLHKLVLKRILRAPMSFFDTTPTGRILNRFTKDIYTIDQVLPRTVGMFLSTAFSSVATVAVIAFVTPFFLCALLPLGYIYYAVQQYYITSSRELKRLDSISRSPIYANFSETLNGVTTIRAFDDAPRFVVSNEQKVDRNMRAHWSSVVANRWLGVRLEFIGSCIVGLAALFAVLERDNIDPGMAGLSITYSLSITGILNWLVRQVAELETHLVSVERVMQYVDVEQEPPAILPHRPPRDWPSKGNVKIENLKFRYREGLQLVLKGVSCEFKPREKVGVVGRTGAGKSSLMLALFRMVDPAGGRILIDGEDITKIGLFDLRSKLSIIPQDATLFTGKVRNNLDPFNESNDEQLWEALEKVHLKKAIEKMDGQLDAAVAEGGENLSVGQRQLMCLGRALLRQSRILIMDEATAAVDFDTDSLIQKTIREEFADTTVLTIAHRLNTVLDYDRVLVLDRGRIIENDSPQTLLQDPNSEFYSMVHSSGHADADSEEEDDAKES